MPPENPTWSALVFADEHDAAVLTRAVQRGTLQRLGRGIYSGEVAADPAELVGDHLWAILEHEFPGAVFVDRSARTGRPVDGQVFVAHSRQRPVSLSGLTIRPRKGRPAEGDIPAGHGLWLSSPARGLLDNLNPQRPTTRDDRSMSRLDVEEWLEDLLQRHGEHFLHSVRDHARRIAGPLGRTGSLRTLDALIGAALATRDGVVLTSPRLAARSVGGAYDAERVESFAALARELADSAPDLLPALPADATRRQLLPFYEAYFSNFIEGTEFTIGEAADIVFEGRVPDERPADAHDVLGTYQIVADSEEMARAPRRFEEFDELLRTRHAILLGGRPEKAPGRYKGRNNRAGSTEFVDHTLVPGTLHAGFDLGGDLVSPFARAAYLMFLVTEVHPFADGNGRVARIMMNAELVAANEVRVIVPTVYRTNYLMALKGATHNRHFRGLVAMLSYARRYTARIDFSNRRTAEADLGRTCALRDPVEAEAAGIRLLLP